MQEFVLLADISDRTFHFERECKTQIVINILHQHPDNVKSGKPPDIFFYRLR